MTVKEKKPVFPPGMVGHIPPRVERGQAVSAKAPRGACEKCSGQGLVLVPTYDRGRRGPRDSVPRVWR